MVNTQDSDGGRSPQVAVYAVGCSALHLCSGGTIEPGIPARKQHSQINNTNVCTQLARHLSLSRDTQSTADGINLPWLRCMAIYMAVGMISSWHNFKGKEQLACHVSRTRHMTTAFCHVSHVSTACCHVTHVSTACCHVCHVSTACCHVRPTLALLVRL